MSRASTSRKKLPRLHEKSGGYYYVHRNKWTFLGRDYADALRQYAGLMFPKTGKMPELIDRWYGRLNVSKKTLATYGINM